MKYALDYPFASETFAAIFHELDAPSILTCRRVCRLFDTIYHSDSFLQYKIELFSAGMIDQPRCLLTASKKLSLLKSMEDAWRTMSYMGCDGYSICMLDADADENKWKVQGGALIQELPEPDLDMFKPGFVLRQLPAPGRCIEDTQWRYSAENNEDCTLFLMQDFNEDLLALLEASENMDTTGDEVGLDMSFRLLSASTRQPHPSISDSHILPLIPRHFVDANQAVSDIFIWGDSIAVIFAGTGSSCSKLVIRSWKAGASQDPTLVLLGGEDAEITTIDYLTNILIIIGVIYESGPRILVFDIETLSSDNGTTTLSMSDLPYLISLHYPQMAEYAIPIEFSMASEVDPPSQYPHHVPFALAPTHRLLNIVLKSSIYASSVSDLGCMLLLPLDKLLSRLTLPRCEKRDFTWEEWGPTDSLMLEWPESLWDDKLSSVYGMRSAVGRYNSTRNCTEVAIMDFNPRSWKRQGCPNVDPEVVNASTGIFKEDIKTWLPRTVNYYFSESSGDRSWDSIRLTQDHLVVAVVPSEDEEDPHITGGDEVNNDDQGAQNRASVKKINMFRVFSVPESPRCADRVTKDTIFGQISLPRHQALPS